MAFLRATSAYESRSLPARAVPAPPSLADYPVWAELRAESRAFLTLGADLAGGRPDPHGVPAPHSPLPHEIRGTTPILLLFRQSTIPSSRIPLSNVTRGMTQDGHDRYWIAAARRRGGMTRAVRR